MLLGYQEPMEAKRKEMATSVLETADLDRLLHR